MQAFTVPEDTSLDTSHFYRQYPATEGDTISMDSVFVVVSGEPRLLKEQRDKIQEQTETASKEDAEQTDEEAIATSSHMKGYKEEVFLRWPAFPPHLGRVSSRFVQDDALHTHEEPAPLLEQAQALRQRKPHQQHFRIAIINGFGSNLGDNLVGMTALRHAIATLQTVLPSVSVDFLFGPDTSKANLDTLLSEPFVEQVRFLGLTVEQFAHYDAFFDFSLLITYPNYDTMPTVDWYLWWMGLDPQVVPASQKRNQLTIRWDAWQTVAHALKQAGDEPVFFNPKASVPLRSMPEKVASRFVKALLDTDKRLHLVVDRPLSFVHKRVLDLSETINSAEHFKALVALSSGMITVNTFGSHVADASCTPTVQICSVFPPTHYPYYPYSENINIPEYETLPAYRRCKVEEHEWKDMENTYTESWKNLDVQRVIALLQKKQALYKEAQETHRIHLIHKTPTKECISKAANASRIFVRQQIDALWNPMQRRLAELADKLLKPGMCCILGGAGESALPRSIARAVGSEGMIHVFEPRKAYAQLLFADCTDEGLFHVQVHTAAPISEASSKGQIPHFDPWSESNPAHWGNAPGKGSVPLTTLDAQEFPYCQLLIIQPPFSAKEILTHARELLARCRPILFIGTISQEEALATCKSCIGYNFWAESARPDKSMSHMLLVGIPEEKKAELHGFSKVEFV